MTDNYTMYQLQQELMESYHELIDEYDDKDSAIHEIIDGCIPVYYSDLADLLADNTELGFPREEYTNTAKTSCFEMIQYNLYYDLMEWLLEKIGE